MPITNAIYKSTTLTSDIQIPQPSITTADSIQILTVNLNLTQPGPATLWLSFCPLDSSSGTLFLDQTVNMAVNDVITAAGSDSNVANVLDDIESVILEYCQNNNIFGLGAQVATPPANNTQ